MERAPRWTPMAPTAPAPTAPSGPTAPVTPTAKATSRRSFRKSWTPQEGADSLKPRANRESVLPDVCGPRRCSATAPRPPPNRRSALLPPTDCTQTPHASHTSRAWVSKSGRAKISSSVTTWTLGITRSVARPSHHAPKPTRPPPSVFFPVAGPLLGSRPLPRSPPADPRRDRLPRWSPVEPLE